MQTVGAKTGIIYCRVSSKEQVEGTSLEMQERLCRDYAKKNGIEVLQIFVDKGESAKTINRPEFLKAIKLCSDKKHPVEFFIVYKIDRFARNQNDHVSVQAILKRVGTKLRSVTEPINEEPMGKAMEGMMSVFAELDNNLRSERCKNGMVERVKQGIWVWPAPIGFYRPRKGSNIAPDPTVKDYIVIVFEEWAKGIHSYKSLAKFMAERGLRTRHSKKPFPQLIESIIKNEIYCGIINAWGMRIKGGFEPIISEELFLQCQPKSKAHAGPRQSSNPDFPLNRTICLSCMSSMTGSYSHGNGGAYPYYHHHKQNCTNAKFIPKATFEEFFVEYLHKINPDAKYEKWFRAIMLDIWQSNFKKFDELNGKVRKEIEKLEQERQEVFNLHRRGIYDDEELLEQKNIVNQKLREKTQLLVDNRIEEFNMDEALEYCFGFVRDTAATWLRLKHEPRLRFQKNISPEKWTFDGKKFGTTKLAKIYALKEEYGGQKSNLVDRTGFGPVASSLQMRRSTN
jgi:site-specific DNA recombinase